MTPVSNDWGLLCPFINQSFYEYHRKQCHTIKPSKEKVNKQAVFGICGTDVRFLSY